jgi:Fe-S oxidoreductase
MDFILAFILSGLILAVIKRFSAKAVGMKKTTRLKPLDKIALTSLWLIFPSRLLAESLTCGAYGTGSFLTGTLGTWLASFLPANQVAYPFWWLYSLSLGAFFVLLPLTRYMHIPTELFLIFMRNSGIRTGDKSGTFTEVQIHSCSSCGICIDACQMSFSAGINNMQSAYLIKAIRNDEDTSRISFNCLMCGRCDTKCPVGIELSPVRMIQRRNDGSENRIHNTWNGYFRTREYSLPVKQPVSIPSYDFLHAQKQKKTDILYFAGCMTHLTPSIKISMARIFDSSGLKWSFMDENGGVCCGRPLMLAGNVREARELINFNSQLIRKSGAHTLVTSCPICYKVFMESYYLDIEVFHHTQFIKKLIEEDIVKMNFLNKRVTFHSPCELGRNSGIYDEPKEVLMHIASLEKTDYDDENSLCCGGSLANLLLDSSGRHKIASFTASVLSAPDPDCIVTACPLCKKTIAAETKTKVTDIAEIVAESLVMPVTSKIHQNIVRTSMETMKV